MFSALAALCLTCSLFGGGLLDGLFGGGDGDCQAAQERAARTMQKIAKEWPLRPAEDPVSDYARRIGKRLARVIDPGFQRPWDFYVLRDAEPSAFAVGGGRFVISDGLIAFVRNESELAAVLAHELSHQSLGHFCRRPSPTAKRIDRGTVVQQYDLKEEMDADRGAIHLLTAAGFDPAAMASVLRCLAHRPNMTETDLEKRIQALQKQGTSEEGEEYVSSVAFGEVQGLVMKDLGDSARPECR